MQLTQAEKVGALKRVFLEDIELFGRFFFPDHLKLATPPFHLDIYRLCKSDRKRVAVAAPRGHSKSTIVDLVYLCWVIVHQKASFVLLVSDTYSQAALFLETLKAELESNEQLKMFYGNQVTAKWAEGDIVCGGGKGVMVKAVGAGMKVRGLKYRNSRPDLVIIDDLENDEIVESKERREKLERWFNGALIPCLSREGRVVMIGTILHYDSLLCKILGKDTYMEFTKRIYKAIANGKALWPEHLDLAKLEDIKQDYINKGQGFLFYQEYQNDPVSDEHRKFKVEKIKYLENENELLGKQLNTFITIDRAYSLAKTAFQYTLKPALDDEMRKRNMFFMVEELKDLGRNKNVRIEGLVPRFETGSVYLKRGQTDLVDELLRFPKGAHDDLIDALSYQLELASSKPGLGGVASVFRPGGLGYGVRRALTFGK